MITNKIEITIPKITNMCPEPFEIKQFANNFSNTEWNKLCLNREFNNAILTDLAKAKQVAEKILLRTISAIKKEKEIVLNAS